MAKWIDVPFLLLAGSGPKRSPLTTPRTAAEEVVAGIWSEVLGLERIGIHDNFFEIGGHSLLATQVVARLREALHWEVPLRSLFEAPTVAKLAQHLERTLLGEARWSAPPLHSLSRPDKLPLSFAQQRLWFLEQWAPGTPTYNLPVPLRLSGRLAVRAFVQAIGEIVRRHETLRTAFTVHESSPVQRISAFQPLSLAVVDLNGLPAGQRETLALQLVNQEMQQPFDLAQGPLWRVGLVRLGEEEHMLWWTLHHSHRGWLVAGPAPPRTLDALPGDCARATIPFAGTRGAVRGLRTLAKALALQGELLGDSIGVLEAAFAGCSPLVGVADRPTATRGADLCRGSLSLCAAARTREMA